MINTLYLPELREMLAEEKPEELREFCSALHPARTAEFMAGLTPPEAWQILRFAEPSTRHQIFGYFDHETQAAIIEGEDRTEVSELIAQMPADDRVDVLNEVDPEVVAQLLPLLPAEERRDILRLQSYPEGTAGAGMTTEVAKLSESLTVHQALEELQRQSEELETIYYLYVVDDEDHLRGIVSARQLIASMGRNEVTLGDLMEADVVAVHVRDDQEEVASKVARFDLHAIPVIDDEHHMLGIITHDDVVDVVREEAIEDAHLSAAVNPLEQGYLRTNVWRLAWNRGIWLTILFVAALLTAFALESYETPLAAWPWLVWFIPLVISSGGNTGNQSATLIITALTAGHITLQDVWKVLHRELLAGLILGGFLASCGFVVSWLVTPVPHRDLNAALVLSTTLLLVVLAGTLLGSMLPLMFKRLGLDPALMSNPFVAGIIDIAGIVIYMNVAMALLK